MKFEVKTLAAGEQGIFATEPIAKGETITNLTGTPITLGELEKKNEDGEISVNRFIQTGTGTFIQLTGESALFNHSCNPNAGITGINKLFALQNINTGDEITYDYSTTIGPQINEETFLLNCNNNEDNCRTKIGNVSTLPKEVIKKYQENNALPDIIENQLYLSE